MTLALGKHRTKEREGHKCNAFARADVITMGHR